MQEEIWREFYHIFIFLHFFSCLFLFIHRNQTKCGLGVSLHRRRPWRWLLCALRILCTWWHHGWGVVKTLLIFLELKDGKIVCNHEHHHDVPNDELFFSYCSTQQFVDATTHFSLDFFLLYSLLDERQTENEQCHVCHLYSLCRYEIKWNERILQHKYERVSGWVSETTE